MPTVALTLCFPGSRSSEANLGEREEPVATFEEEEAAVILEGGEGRRFLEEEEEEDAAITLGGGEGDFLLEGEEEEEEEGMGSEDPGDPSHS